MTLPRPSRRKAWNWQFTLLTIKPVWTVPHPHAVQAPWRARNTCYLIESAGYKVGVAGPFHRWGNWASERLSSTLSPSAARMNMWGSSPCFSAFKARLFHYITHSARFKEVRTWRVLCLLALEKKNQLWSFPAAKISIPQSVETWFYIGSISPDTYQADLSGARFIQKVNPCFWLSFSLQHPCGCQVEWEETSREKGRTMTPAF